MATTDLRDVFTTLFSAPMGAAVDAEREYRKIWIDWLKDAGELLKAAKKENQHLDEAETLKKHLELAPVMNFEALVEIGLTMRIAEVKEKSIKGSAGLGLSVLQVSGSYGFMERSSQESVLQARAQYSLSNTQKRSLSEYLGQYSITLTDATSLDKAIKFLETPPAEILQQPKPINEG